MVGDVNLQQCERTECHCTLKNGWSVHFYVIDILPQFKKIKATLGRKVQVDTEINQGQQTKAPWGGSETKDPRPTMARVAST